MKKYIKYLPIILFALLSTSCLKSGLDDLPAFSDAEITNFRFEYRWIQNTNGNDQLHVAQMTVAKTINDASGAIDCTITVPPVNADFPQSERDKVSLSNLVGYADISLAANLKPVGDSPKLGVIADFSGSNMQYEVVAADGTTKKTWTLVISKFTK